MAKRKDSWIAWKKGPRDSVKESRHRAYRKSGSIQPRSSRVTFHEAVERVFQEHGDTLRELADK